VNTAVQADRRVGIIIQSENGLDAVILIIARIIDRLCVQTDGNIIDIIRPRILHHDHFVPLDIKPDIRMSCGAGQSVETGEFFVHHIEAGPGLVFSGVSADEDPLAQGRHPDPIDKLSFGGRELVKTQDFIEAEVPAENIS
jgi:hypothetical protein